MVVLTCLSLIFGAVVGYRYSVFFLIPAIIFTFVAAIGFSAAVGSGFWSTVLTIIAALICLQIGYLASAALGIVLQSRNISARAEFFTSRRKVPQRTA